MPCTLTATIWSHSATGVSRAGPSSMTPALLTRVSSRPSSASVRSTAAAACSSLVTSASTTSAVPPAPAIVAASSASRSRRRATRATAAPSAASLRAVAAPIPLLEPVIRATVPVSGVVMVDDARGNGRTRSSAMDFRLEVVVIPVSDVDRAKAFYQGLGWRLDADFAFDNGFRVVQLTPPGTGCSVQFGANITSAAPGSAQGLYLIVSDIEAARDELLGRGVTASEVFHPGEPSPVPARGRERPD